MALLGHVVDDAGFVHLTRGYQTDHLAEVSLEFVWCLEPHCPASTLDWDAAATPASSGPRRPVRSAAKPAPRHRIQNAATTAPP